MKEMCVCVRACVRACVRVCVCAASHSMDMIVNSEIHFICSSQWPCMSYK